MYIPGNNKDTTNKYAFSKKKTNFTKLNQPQVHIPNNQNLY